MIAAVLAREGMKLIMLLYKILILRSYSHSLLNELNQLVVSKQAVLYP
jgi:hypothetical protein